MSDIGIQALVAFFVPLGTAVAMLFAAAKWGGDAITKRISDHHAANVKPQIEAVDHRSRNHGTRLDAIEHLRTTDIERIVKLEAAVTGFERSIERIEKGQEKLAENMQSGFDALATSIREIRTVSPRP